jgi:hypothetical protein
MDPHSGIVSSTPIFAPIGAPSVYRRHLRRLGARRVRLRGGSTGSGAERAVSASRSSRHQRNALIGEPEIYRARPPCLASGVGRTPGILVRRSGRLVARLAGGQPQDHRGTNSTRPAWITIWLVPCASGQASRLKWRTCRRIGAPPKHRSDGNGYGLQIIRPAPHRGGARR